MKAINVDSEKCRTCGLCSKICPMRCLGEDEGKNPFFKDGKQDLCLECGHCEAICPFQALKFESEDMVSFSGEFRSEFDKVVKSRRSYRSFKKEPVDKEVIENAIDAAYWSPTSKNSRDVSWIVVTDTEMIKKLGGLVVKSMESNPKLQAIVNAYNKGIDIIFREAPALFISYVKDDSYKPEVDSAVAATTLELALQEQGIGTCWAGFFMTACPNSDEIYETLGINKDTHSIYSSLFAGVPQLKFKNIPPRKKIEVRYI